MNPAGMKTIARLQSSLLLAVLILGFGQMSGCATTANSDHDSQTVDYDPLESLNRKVYGINMVVDKAVLKPLAKGYKKVVPAPVRRGITNFFSNLTTPRSALNNFLQGKPRRGFNEFGRFLFNSTLGLGGFIDIAGAGGMERYDENFSQTLSVWGVPDGPYLVLPFFGPSMATDALALPVDFATDLWSHYDNTSVRDKVWLLRTVELRYRLLSVESALEDWHDPYIALREAFMQNRTFRIYDGEPPDDEEFYEDEMFDDFFEESD